MANPARQFRVSDELWTEAKDVLRRRGTTRNAFLVDKLTELVEVDRAERAFVEGLTSTDTPAPTTPGARP